MIDFMGLDENDIICIFMNINEDVENRDTKKTRETMVVSRFWMGYKIYLASLKSIFMAASVFRETTLMP